MTISFTNLSRLVGLGVSVVAFAGPAVGAEWPDIRQAKEIAEEGFIYGLPLVMNYAVMYEFAVDTKSSQFKAPFNQLNSMHRVATYEDTAVVTPNSDTPYTTLWLDLRAEPMVISVPAVPKERYYSVQRSEEHTSELQSHRDLHSFPTRRSSDLAEQRHTLHDTLAGSARGADGDLGDGSAKGALLLSS